MTSGELVIPNGITPPAGRSARLDLGGTVRTVARFLAEFDPKSSTAAAYARDLGVAYVVHRYQFDELVAGLYPRRLRTMLAGRAPSKRAAAPDLTWLPACLDAGVDPLAATADHTRAWVIAMSDRVRPDGKPALSAQARGRRLSAVSSLYDWLVGQDLATANPADAKRVDRQRAGLRIDRHHSTTAGLTGDQLDLLVFAADYSPGINQDRNAAMLAVLATLGLRVEELTQLVVGDYGTDAGYRVLDVTRKGGQVQRLPVPPVATARLDAYLTGRGDRAELVRTAESGAGSADRPLLATVPYRGSPGGGRLDRAEIRHVLRRIARSHPDLEYLAEQLHPHVLRHSVTTRLLKAGVPEWRVQELMGHKDAATTQRYNRADQALVDSSAHEAGRLLERGLASLAARTG